ncbi:MAG: DUF29 domain-containing protein [Acidobacteriota bacterium]|nr:DUF29 domain-containing protein [Acidobacteriota bacterium]MDQ3249665.1 DUF29 domain-containing protein [Chloroflexota bacterium]
MQELYELRAYIERGKYPEALLLLGEMEEMSREDKINKVYSFLDILLLHLIKQQAEKRTTRSWDFSIRQAVRQINRTNKRQHAGGYYLSRPDLIGAIDGAYEEALDHAALEAFEGRYDPPELGKMVDADRVKAEALKLILPLP